MPGGIAASHGWLAALRAWLLVMGSGNLLWEAAHLPLYKIWRTGTWRENAFAVVHCTGGDLLIATASLTLALLLAGHGDWPARRFGAVAALTMAFGVGYTAFSEWLNIVVRASWAYSEHMPVVRLGDFELGLSPIAQWIIVPLLAFAWARRSAPCRSKADEAGA